ncbi:FABP family protein [Xylanimonas oleitrophica]|uniref:Ferric nitrobindin-like protein n=1 Tax=Xylanimonas oleitrophica TaxID=2607479 RepID=A0A2W5WLT0_9MICO|nr:FABP family protein [Xylanimonas oleitrophica]PZR51653.1 FABP family protein [Xylanimonas oleitrophica]
MPFAFPEGLAPEVYPLAWLVGRWRGEGVVEYPGIESRAFVNDVVFDHDGGPYLRFESTIRVLDTPPPAVPGTAGAAADEVPDFPPSEGEWPEPVAVPESAEAGVPAPEETAGTVWSTETGYWRVSSDRPDGMEEDRHALEVLVADASGRMSLFLGMVGNGRVDLATDFVARTSTASEVTAAKRLYGLVEGQLMWVEDLAAFGHPLRSYASARLDRV